MSHPPTPPTARHGLARWFRRAPRLIHAVMVLGLAAAVTGQVAAQTAGYQACLGCAEHQEMRTRWHRPFVIELAGEGLLMFNHFRLERDAADLGLCETDILIRGGADAGGCHHFSATRAWLIEAPLEVGLFTSPAWGLARRGHPRWAMVWELVPIVYHAWSASETVHTIHQYQRLSYLYQ